MVSFTAAILTETQNPTALLVHGLWYGKISLKPLATRLKRHGFNCVRFSYPTIRQTLAENARALYQFAAELDISSLDLVGHSLGGLVILRMLDEFGNQLPRGRVVLLGSPVHGSAVARSLSRLTMTKPLSRTFIGRAAGGLEYGFAHAPPGRPTGIIAGTTRLGAGQLVSRLEKPHDGTVAVSETQLPGAADTLLLPASHTGLITSGRVAGCVAAFLKQGYF